VGDSTVRADNEEPTAGLFDRAMTLLRQLSMEELQELKLYRITAIQREKLKREEQR